MIKHKIDYTFNNQYIMQDIQKRLVEKYTEVIFSCNISGALFSIKDVYSKKVRGRLDVRVDYDSLRKLFSLHNIHGEDRKHKSFTCKDVEDIKTVDQVVDKIISFCKF